MKIDWPLLFSFTNHHPKLLAHSISFSFKVARQLQRLHLSSQNLADPLLGKSAVVTGAGHGIGRSIALELARLGADVGINYLRSKDAATKTKQEIEDLGRKAVLLPCDVASEDQVRAMADLANNGLGKVDLLVNNAGGSGGAKDDAPIEKANMTDWNLIIGANLTGAFLCTHFFSKGMLERKSGHVINISSVCGVTGDCGPAYCSAKAGMIGLTKACAVSLAPYVRVNAVLPGFVSSSDFPSETLSAIPNITPVGRIGGPEEIAELVGHLTCMKSPFLTGACITMDGGITNGIIGLSVGWSKVRK